MESELESALTRNDTFHEILVNINTIDASEKNI